MDCADWPRSCRGPVGSSPKRSRIVPPRGTRVGPRREEDIKIMTDETNSGKTELTSPSRREVVTKAAQVAVTAPAVALLLNATSKNAFAQASTYAADVPGAIDVTDTTRGPEESRDGDEPADDRI